MPAPRFGRSEVCRAMADFRGMGGPRSSGMERLRPEEMRDLRNAGDARVRVRVGAAGEVLDVRLERSSRSRMVDDMALQAARTMRYLPELVDGAAVAAWAESFTRTRRM